MFIFLSIILAGCLNQIVLMLSYQYLSKEGAVIKSYKEFTKRLYYFSLAILTICFYLSLIKYDFTLTFFVLAILSSIFAILSSIFAIIAICDYYSLTVPNEASYGLVLPSIVISYFIFDRTDLFLGGFFAFMILYTLRYLFLKFRGVEALGLGDIKLIFSLGILVGLSNLYTLLCVATFSALIYALFTKKAIPFAPFLCLGTFISIILSS